MGGLFNMGGASIMGGGLYEIEARKKTAFIGTK